MHLSEAILIARERVRGFSMNYTAVAVAVGGDGQGTRQYTTGVVHDDLLRAACDVVRSIHLHAARSETEARAVIG